MHDIHDSAAAGYAVAAGTYAEGRPGYPPETAPWLRDVVGLDRARTVLDLGAGTGAFIPWLAGTGAKVLALEPVAAMRQRLQQAYRDVEIVDGLASAIQLPDESLDAVVCAQSFHWLATADALTEILRVLRPGGVLGLIWNGRDETVPWVAALSAITDEFEGDAPRYKTGCWRRLFPFEGLSALAERHARYAHVGSPEQVIVARTMSVSFVAALPAAERQDVERRVRALVSATPELAGQARVAFPYETSMFAYRRERHVRARLC